MLPPLPPLQKSALPEHPQDISLHPKCVLCVPHPLPEDLRVVVAAWERLPEAVKSSIAHSISDEQGATTQCHIHL